MVRPGTIFRHSHFRSLLAMSTAKKRTSDHPGKKAKKQKTIAASSEPRRITFPGGWDNPPVAVSADASTKSKQPTKKKASKPKPGGLILTSDSELSSVADTGSSGGSGGGFDFTFDSHGRSTPGAPTPAQDEALPASSSASSNELVQMQDSGSEGLRVNDVISTLSTE